MLSHKLVSGLRATIVSTIITRYKKMATDPVQQLFIDKIREYKQKSPDGSFVEPNAGIIRELAKEFEKLDKQYGGGPGIDMTAFPEFKFAEPVVDPIDEVAPKKKGKGKGGKRKEKAKDRPVKKKKKPFPKAVKKPDPKTDPKKK